MVSDQDMDYSRSSRDYVADRQRHRSRSSSVDSAQERRRIRRRREREAADSDDRRSARYDDRDRRSTEKRDRYGDRGNDGRTRRSRSPEEYTSRRHRHHGEPKHRHKDPGSASPHSQYNSKTHRKDEEDMQNSRKSKGPLPSQAASFSMTKDPSMAVVHGDDIAEPEKEKQKPNFAPTGVLAAASNTMSQADGTSIVLKYHEPAEARKPPAKDQWKLFVFKGADIVEIIELSLRSCWLVGRELAVVDMPAEHPSISKQHAVIQFRWIEKRNEFGDKLGRVRPYLIDLDSANGTTLNKEPVPGSRYLELRDKDMIQFGHSTREYVLMLPPKD